MTIGEAAHIRAASPGGPRYDYSQSRTDRSGIDNALWLCAKCATLIDKGKGAAFTVDTLKRWKKTAEQNSHNALLFGQSMKRPDWLDRIHYAQFINVPRLASVLGARAYFSRFALNENRGFRGQGMMVAPISLSIETALAASEVEAIPIEEVFPPSEDFIGQVISFDHRCYTKNGVDAGSTCRKSLLSNFDARLSPYFYIKVGQSRAIFPYDPAWITTSTAYCDFRSGHTRFAGLGIVKRIDPDQDYMIISPLIVTLPQNSAMKAFYEIFEAD